jgi:hypothetical protein
MGCSCRTFVQEQSLLSVFALHVAAFGHVPTESSRGENRATQASNPHVKTAFEEVARAGLLLAEQMEWMDRQEETREGEAPR